MGRCILYGRKIHKLCVCSSLIHVHLLLCFRCVCVCVCVCSIRIQDVSVHQIPRLHDFLPNLPSYPNRFARTKSTIRAGIVTASSHHHHGHQPAGPFQLSRGIKAGVPQSELAQQHHLHHPPEEVQYSQFIKEGDVVLLDIVRRSGLGPGGAKSFIRAGPREEIVWAPGEAVAAIVTCGGLCPGLNDVIAELFNTLFYNYVSQ